MAAVAIGLGISTILGGYLAGKGAEEGADISTAGGIESTRISAEAQKEIAKLRVLTDLDIAQLSAKTGIQAERIRALVNLETSAWDNITQTEIANLSAATNLDISKISAYTKLSEIPTALPGQRDIANVLANKIKGEIGEGLPPKVMQAIRGRERTAGLQGIESALASAKKTYAGQGIKGGGVASGLRKIQETAGPMFAGIENKLTLLDFQRQDKNILDAMNYMQLRGAPTKGDITGAMEKIGKLNINPAFAGSFTPSNELSGLLGDSQNFTTLTPELIEQLTKPQEMPKVDLSGIEARLMKLENMKSIYDVGGGADVGAGDYSGYGDYGWGGTEGFGDFGDPGAYGDVGASDTASGGVDSGAEEW